jgi:pimeloyl-ACP methyl ester carboxylesterase
VGRQFGRFELPGSTVLAVSLLIGGLGPFLPSSRLVSEASLVPRQEADVPRFEFSDCDWPLYEGMEESEIICGYLVVPERHDNPTGPTLELAVMILLMTGPRSEHDPIVWNTGGPGGSSIDDWGWFLAQSPLRETRNIILMDQRGNGHSRPRLECPEVDWSGEGDLATCTLVNAEKGIDLRAFNTREAAADLVDLRKVFDIGKLNLYGVSYGTLLVLETLRSFSSEVRSAVIDGVLPPGVDPFDTERVAALDLLVDRCAQDQDCSRDYPTLREEYEGLLAHDVRIPGNPMWVSGMKETLRTAMYWDKDLPAIPLAIHMASAGMDGYLNALIFFPWLPAISEVSWMTVFCSDIGPSSEGLVTDLGFCTDANPSGSEPEAPAEDPQPWTTDGIAWGEPVSSDVPVLILNGEFDPITPPAYGERAAETLPNSYDLTFPGYAHGAAADRGCADSLIAAFFDDPYVRPDTSCIADLPPLHFLGPQAADRVILRDPVGADVLIAGLARTEATSSWVWPVVGRALLVLHGVWSLCLGILVLASVFEWSRRKRPAGEDGSTHRRMAWPWWVLVAVSCLAMGAIVYSLSWSAPAAILIGTAGLVPVWLVVRSISRRPWRRVPAQEQAGDGPSAPAPRPVGVLFLTKAANLLTTLAWVLAGWVLLDLVLFAAGLRGGTMIIMPLMLRPYSQVATVLFVPIAALGAAGGVMKARSVEGSRWRKVTRAAPAMFCAVFLFLLLPLAVLGLTV